MDESFNRTAQKRPMNQINCGLPRHETAQRFGATAQNFSLVAFVASVLTHARNVIAGRRRTCRFWHAKVLRASVQLLQLLPFRPEFKPFYSLVNELSQRIEIRRRIPKRGEKQPDNYIPENLKSRLPNQANPPIYGLD